jgi:tetratricopeptide (TPR) repeat protein/predicted Ser/Thr protein kinase
VSAGHDGLDLRALLDSLERLEGLNDAERDAELRRIEADDPAQAERLRRICDDDKDASRWFDGLEQALGRGMAAELDAAWAPGRTMGPYRLDRLLATGGMDAVFLARKADGELKRPVALKLVPPGLLSDEARDRFRRERDLLAGLSHPNIASLIDAGVDRAGQPWFAMEYIEGVRFDEWCRRPAVPRSAALEQLRALAQAVAFAHRNLVVHGDLKPANVMIDAHGRLRLLDFGVARLLDESSEGRQARYMTPGYAAPELHRGQRPRPPSDVFALGRMLADVLSWTASKSPMRERELRAMVEVATDSAPDRRYESAAAFADDLKRAMTGFPVEAWNGGLSYRFVKRLQRHPGASLGVAAGVLMLVGFSVHATLQAERFQHERDSAQQLAGFLEQVFVSADPDQSPGEPLTARQLLDRGREGLAADELEPQVRSRFLSILGRTYQRLGEYGPAAELLDEALTAPSLPLVERIDLQIERAETDRLAGRFDEAEDRLHGLLETLPVNDRMRRARVLAGLGRTMVQAGRPADAISMLEQGIELTRSSEGHSLETLSDRLNDLGSALFRLGRFDEAIARLNEALPLREAADRAAGHEPASPRTATLINNLALMHYLAGRPDEAEPRFRQALTLRRALLPPDHPDLAQTLSNLGLMLKDYGSIEESVQILTEALEVRRAGLEPEHYRIAQAMLNLGVAQRDSGDLDPAAVLLVDARDRLINALGAEHPQVAVAHNELGRLHLAQGRAEAAEADHRRALAIQRSALPQGHPHLAWSLVGLGRALEALGQNGAARQALVEAVEIRQQALPEQDPLRIEAEQALAELDAGWTAASGSAVP